MTVYINGIPVEDVGEGALNFFLWDYASIGQGTWIFAMSATGMLQGRFYNSSDADGDNLTLKAFLGAGTYTMRVIHYKGTNMPIFDIDIGGTEVASIDAYFASDSPNNITTITDIAIAASGLKDIVVRVDGKNPSSSNYLCGIQSIHLWRTA